MTDTSTTSTAEAPRRSGWTLAHDVLRHLARIALGLALAFAGYLHLTSMRLEFQAQVPPWVPLDPDFVVVASGIVEIVLGVALVVSFGRVRPLVGVVVAAFFVAIFPGNISQWANGISAFGLDTDTQRAVRLLFQPLLVAWALWCTRGWALVLSWFRSLRDRRRQPA